MASCCHEGTNNYDAGASSRLGGILPVPSGAGRWFGPLALVAILLMIVLVVLPFDPLLSGWVRWIFAEGTIQRRLVKVPNRVYEWWTILVIVVLLLRQVDRKQLLIGFVAAYGICMGAVHLLKFIAGRARPECGIGAYEFSGFGDPRLNLDSFPSGHMAQAVLLTALLAVYLPRSRYVLVPLTVFVGLSRVAQERHYVSDVIAGAGLALLVVLLCRHYLGPAYYRTVKWPWRRRVRAEQSASFAGAGAGFQ